MRNDAEVWGRFHRYWLKSGVPLFVVRYEDLRNTPDATLSALARWIDGEDRASPPTDAASAPPVPASTTSALPPLIGPAQLPGEHHGTPYTPRVGGIGKALKRFDDSPELLAEVTALAGEAALRNFGYHPLCGFPAEAKRPNYEGGKCIRKGIRAININDPAEAELRAEDDPFGRRMTDFRKLHTAGDSEPLAVVSGQPFYIPPAPSPRSSIGVR